MIPKKLMAARIFANAEFKEDLPFPDINSKRWVDVNDYRPNGRLCPLCWVKGENNTIHQAFYCNFPGERKHQWFHRTQDAIIENVTHWRHLDVDGRED